MFKYWLDPHLDLMTLVAILESTDVIVATSRVLHVMDETLMDLNTKGIITDETMDFLPTKVKSKLECEMTSLALITPSILHHVIQTHKLHIKDHR